MSYDLVYMTSASTGSPFSTSSVSGYTPFENVFVQNEGFIASFKDGSDNYMVAYCSLDGSDNVVVDDIIFSSDGQLTSPTFSGTVDIAITATTYNTYQKRRKNYDIGDGSHTEYVMMDNSGSSSTSTATVSADTLNLYHFSVELSGWYYRFYCGEKSGGAGTGDYYFGIYNLKSDGTPNVLKCHSVIGNHGNSNADVQLDLDSTLTLTAATQANPVVVTYTGTDPANGDRIYITDAGGMTEINDRSFIVSSVDTGANTFELQGEDGTGHTAYTSGGTIHLPVFLHSGDYVLGVTADTSTLRYNGYDNDETSCYGWCGIRTGASRCNFFQKSYTFATLPTDPMSSGAYSDQAGAKIAVGLKMVAD